MRQCLFEVSLYCLLHIFCPALVRDLGKMIPAVLQVLLNLMPTTPTSSLGLCRQPVHMCLEVKSAICEAGAPYAGEQSLCFMLLIVLPLKIG